MIVYANKKHTESDFFIGGWVYLRLQLYKQISLSLQSNFKLGPKFYGLYQILDRNGKVARELTLHKSALVNHIFHVSLLKQHIRENITSSLTLPSVCTNS